MLYKCCFDYDIFRRNNYTDQANIGAPYKPPCVPTDAQSIDAIAAAEARIAASMAYFIEGFLIKVTCVPDLDKQALLVRKILCAYSCKEKAIAEVISALSGKILADKGLLPGDPCC